MNLGKIITGTALGLALAFSPTKVKNQDNFVLPCYTIGNSTRYDWEAIRGDTSYEGVVHDSVDFQEIGKGLFFDIVEVHKKGCLVDRIAIVKIDPKFNDFRVFSGYDETLKMYESYTIEEWQRKTGANVLINSAQYQADPWGRPCALMICDGERKGPKKNQSVRGMFLAEPKNSTLPQVQFLDSQYDKLDDSTHMFHQADQYNQGVAHWPILLNRKDSIKVFPTDWQANRTAIAKNKEENILMFTTEGGFFNLYNFGRFLRESGLNIETAMALDGGYEAEMAVQTPGFDYMTYGQFETYGPEKDASVPRARCTLPSVIGVFPREE